MNDREQQPNGVSEASIIVLTERLGGAIDDIKEMKGTMANIHSALMKVGAVERDVISAQATADEAVKKSEDNEKELSKVREEVNTNAKVWKVMGVVAVLFSGAVGVFYTQWHPWSDDIRIAKDKRDEQLTANNAAYQLSQREVEARLAVLEFRANNLDGKPSK